MLRKALPTGCSPPQAHLALAWSCSPCSVFLSSRSSSQAQSGLAKPRAELSSPVWSYAELWGLACLPLQTSCALPCQGSPGAAGRAGCFTGSQRKYLWLKLGAAAEEAGTALCKQEVISQGEGFKGRVTWHCTKPKAGRLLAAGEDAGLGEMRGRLCPAVPGRPQQSPVCVWSCGTACPEQVAEGCLILATEISL